MDNMSYPVILTLMVPKESKSYRHIYFTCFFIIYLLILSINIRLVMIIIMTKALHEPMYIFLSYLCVNGVYGATGFYPKILSDLMLDSYVISSLMCALQIFVIYSSLLSEFTILTVMSYDRYVAICKPLDYHSKITNFTCVKLILFSWILPNGVSATAILLSYLRPFCKYHIDKLYCDNWSVVKLSCTSSFVNNIYGYIFALLFISCAVIVIVSYVKLISACKTSLENRRKFWQTCLPHMLSLINFTFALLFDITYSRYGSNDIPESLRHFLALELVIVPPVFNPVMYGLNIRTVRRVFFSCISARVNVLEAKKA
ncbi:olfactory receptor 5M3-like [Megalobrama amblycephala]|uniref:olfactory receptor 5M3-like n=1 Tax=Megalobrama amblycephala TaxID=75352 RepID=UPI0020143529|nr:olfactory receptor 5M3-like [Megalobrama amblycephala]XP_048066973.1 olfactory receptor 5M3-like [Megalobrama amblycephala]